MRDARNSLFGGRRAPRSWRAAACMMLIAALGLSVVVAVGLPAAAQNNPFILNIIPAQGTVGTTVVINGSDFGLPTINTSVTFNGVAADPSYWSATNILVTVPAGATTGPVVVKTSTGANSNGVLFTVTGTNPLAPRIINLVPNQGPVGMSVAINGTNFGTRGSSSKVAFNRVPATILTWSDNVITTTVPQKAKTGNVVVTTSLGQSNGVKFTVTTTPTPSQSWYLAEGCTHSGFETYILLENTTGIDATVTVYYDTPQFGRMRRPQDLNVPPNSRVTLHVNSDFVGVGVDVSTELQSSQPIVAERAMYWNNRKEGHDSIGVTALSKTWYLAEGFTANGYETWILVQNPGSTGANLDVTYMKPNGTVHREYSVGAGQRYTIDVGKEVGGAEVSTKITSNTDVVCERAMYWDGRRGGHDSIGVTEGSNTWYLAEGSTAWGFKTYLLLQNPSTKTAKVDVTYMATNGSIKLKQFSMKPNTRKTLLMNDKVKNDDASIGVVSDQEIIAERAMYWDNETGKAGHDTIGVTAPAKTIYLAEGSTAWGFQTYVCIQNPNDKAVDVSVTYLKNDGAQRGKTCTVKANRRSTIFLNKELENKDASIKLEAPLPITAERAMYWNEKGGGHVSIGWMK